MSTGSQHTIGRVWDSLSPLRSFLDDERVIEIMFNGPDRPVAIERLGEHIHETNVRLTSNQAQSIVTLLAMISRRHVDLTGGNGHQIVSAKLPPHFRIEAQLPPVAVNGPYITIRRNNSLVMRLDEYVRQGIITEEVAARLIAAVKAKLNILVVGGTSSGKTTFLNSLIAEIDPGERPISIETIIELVIPHGVAIRFEADDEQGLTVQRILKSVLRSRPDRILVGEVRGGEAFDFMDAANSGHPGSMGTIHANGPEEGLDRLENLVLEGRPQMPLAAIRKRIAQTFQLVVYMERGWVGGKRARYLKELIALNGLDQTSGAYQIEHIYRKEMQ